MKRIICFFVLVNLLFPMEVYPQEKKSGNFQVQVNYLNVNGKLRGGNNSGIGLEAEYHFNLIKSIGLEGLGGIGYDRIFEGCPLCNSEWFEHGYWAGIGLSRRIYIKDKHSFVAQVRYRLVGFERMEPELIEMDGTIIRWQKASIPQDLLGFRFGYFLPIKLPVVLSYTFENGAFHRMNSISMGFQF